MQTKQSHNIDRPFLISVLLLTVTGFIIFTSASLGLLARDGASFESVAMNQSVSLLIGLVAFVVMSKIHYKNLRKHAFYILSGAILLNLLLFIPALSFSHGGAARWIDLGFITFQPSEFLKIAFIIYFAAWLSGLKDKVSDYKFGLVPYAIIVGLLSLLLLFQRDTDTLVVIAGTGLVMLFIAGGKIRHLLLLCTMMFLLLLGIIMVRPYARQRVMTFFNPAQDTQGASYQINQSLIAIGSGQIAGRGFGQSVQKFNYLPEPIGDSVFAVSSEEFGFIGSTTLVILFLFFFLRSIKIAVRAPDTFGGLTAIGIAILIFVQCFNNSYDGIKVSSCTSSCKKYFHILKNYCSLV